MSTFFIWLDADGLLASAAAHGMIANGYASHGHKTLSCEKDFRKLNFTEVIS